MGIGSFVKKFTFGTPATQGDVEDVAPQEFKATRGTTAEGLTGFLTDRPTAEGPFAAALTGPEADLSTQAIQQAQAAVPGREVLTRTLEEGGAVNPFLQANIAAAQRPTIEAFQESREGLRGAFARAGQRPGQGRRGSSAFQKTLAKEGRKTARTLAQQAGAITSADQTRRRNEQQAAIATAIGVEQADLQRTTAALEAAGLPRTITDTALARAAQQNSTELNQLLQAVKIGGAAGQATIQRIAALAPGDGALSDIASIVGGIFFGPAGAKVGQAAGTDVEVAARA